MKNVLQTFDLTGEECHSQRELPESHQEFFREGTIHDRYDRAAKVKALHQRHVKFWIELVATTCYLSFRVCGLLRFLVDTGRVPDSKEGSFGPLCTKWRHSSSSVTLS